MSSDNLIQPSSVSSLRIRSAGAVDTESYRVYLEHESDRLVSPFHDVPLYADSNDVTLVHMICEIPKWSNAKLEIATGEPMNPIKQDVKKGNLRYVKNLFPLKGYPWNYGALPQTWEDPNATCPHTGFKGDKDPLDVLDISDTVAVTGEIKVVKVLGVVALVDEGETDWKIIAIDIKDPLAAKLDDISDVDKVFPGLLDMTRQWFKMYKVPDGKPENFFAYEGQYKPRDFALKIIEETNHAWMQLMAGKVPNKGADYAIDCSTMQSYDPAKVKPKFNSSSLTIKDIEKMPVDCSKSYFNLFPFYNKA